MTELQKKQHVRIMKHSASRQGFTLALLLTFFGFLAFLAVHPRVSPSTSARVIHTNRASSSSGSSNATPRSTVIVVGAPAVGGTSLGLLDHLLPLTNFSQLSTAQLLDRAAARNLDHVQLRQLVQLHQNLFCAARMHLQPLPGTTKVPFGNVSMHVYDGSDIVSNMLKGEHHTWESGEVQEMLWALQQFADPIQQAVVAKQRRQGGSSNQPPLFVDVGANVGWFALNAAAAGARVAAFEAMPSNVVLIRRSLCSNPWLAERVGLYGTGLGTQPSKCFVISGVNNRGDGHTICDKDIKKELAEQKARSNETYEVRGEMTVRRLDTLLSEDVQVMKIDVEGFELQVLEGAEGLLKNHNVWYIMAEANRGIIKEQGQKRYLRFMDKMGYYISLVGFKGPYIPTETIKQGKAQIGDNVNIYCVRKELLGPEAVAADKAAGAAEGATINVTRPGATTDSSAAKADAAPITTKGVPLSAWN